MMATKPADIPAALTVDVLTEAPAWSKALPDLETQTRRALEAAARGRPPGEVSILFTDDQHMAALNKRFRGRDKPTNVLSFPSGDQAMPGSACLYGDLALAYETIDREAGAAGIPLADHLAHLLVHGFLHLVGYDHETEPEAEAMEALETEILKKLDIPDPYADDKADREVRA